jgi:hypothetical protein
MKLTHSLRIPALRRSVLVTALVILAAPARIHAQEKPPTYTPEQKTEYRHKAADLHAGAAFWAGVAGIGALFSATGVGLGVAIGGGVNATYYEILSSEYSKWAGDPADMNFRIVAVPVVRALPAITEKDGVSANEASALNALLGNLSQMVAVSDAMLTSMNRAQGAALKKEDYWLGRQTQAAKDYALAEADILGRQPALRQEIVQVFRDNGLHESISTAAGAQLQALVKEKGFPKSVSGLLERLGMNSATIGTLETDFVALPPDQLHAEFPDDIADPKVTATTEEAETMLKQFADSIP